MPGMRITTGKSSSRPTHIAPWTATLIRRCHAVGTATINTPCTAITARHMKAEPANDATACVSNRASKGCCALRPLIAIGNQNVVMTFTAAMATATIAATGRA